jgi:Cu-processing system permease protein
MRPRTVLLCAGREVRASLRSRAFVMAAASFLVLSLALAAVGVLGARRAGLAGYDRTSASLLSLCLVFVPLVGLWLGSLGVAGDLEDGTTGMLLSQPVTRLEAYAGKFLGSSVALTAAMAAGFGVTGVVLSLGRGGDLVTYLALAATMLALGVTATALGTLLSSALRSRARVVGASFATWLWLVYASDLGSIGLVVARRLGPAELFALSLVNPVQQARILGTLVLSRRLEVLGPVGIFGLDTLGARGVALLALGELALVTILALAAGYGFFRRTVIP